MAKATHERRQSRLTLRDSKSARDADPVSEPADFELDERLRTLRLNQWFAMAEEGMPLWVC